MLFPNGYLAIMKLYTVLRRVLLTRGSWLLLDSGVGKVSWSMSRPETLETSANNTKPGEQSIDRAAARLTFSNGAYISE